MQRTVPSFNVVNSRPPAAGCRHSVVDGCAAEIVLCNLLAYNGRMLWKIEELTDAEFAEQDPVLSVDDGSLAHRLAVDIHDPPAIRRRLDGGGTQLAGESHAVGCRPRHVGVDIGEASQ